MNCTIDAHSHVPEIDSRHYEADEGCDAFDVVELRAPDAKVRLFLTPEATETFLRDLSRFARRELRKRTRARI